MNLQDIATEISLRHEDAIDMMNHAELMDFGIKTAKTVFGCNDEQAIHTTIELMKIYEPK